LIQGKIPIIFWSVDESVFKGLSYLFDNQFMAAKSVFEEKADWYGYQVKTKINF
jgi:hypothetical protein